MDDMISREAAIEAIAKQSKFSVEEIINICDASIQDDNGWLGGLKEAIVAIVELPSVQPESKLDEWCTDCKEYDHEKHCCPRFNRVIREALKEAQLERKKGEWLINSDGYYPYCSECKRSPEFTTDFCPYCGADMRGEQDDTD